MINDLGSLPNYSPIGLVFTDEDGVTGQFYDHTTIDEQPRQLPDFLDVDGVPIDAA